MSLLPGLDLVDFAELFSSTFMGDDTDVARKALAIRKMVKPMQDSFTALEKVSTRLRMLAAVGNLLCSLSFLSILFLSSLPPFLSFPSLLSSLPPFLSFLLS